MPRTNLSAPYVAPSYVASGALACQITDENRRHFGYSLDALYRIAGSPGGESPEDWYALAEPVLEALRSYRGRIHAATADESGKVEHKRRRSMWHLTSHAYDAMVAVAGSAGHYKIGDALADEETAWLYAKFLDQSGLRRDLTHAGFGSRSRFIELVSARHPFTVPSLWGLEDCAPPRALYKEAAGALLVAALRVWHALEQIGDTVPAVRNPILEAMVADGATENDLSNQRFVLDRVENSRCPQDPHEELSYIIARSVLWTLEHIDMPSAAEWADPTHLVASLVLGDDTIYLTPNHKRGTKPPLDHEALESSLKVSLSPPPRLALLAS